MYIRSELFTIALAVLILIFLVRPVVDSPTFDQQNRLRLRKARGDNRICQVFDSPTLAESECQFSIGPVGVEDPKD